MSRIRNRDLLVTSLRLTLLQSTWCEGTMQSLGLAYGLAPALSRIHENSADLAVAFEHLKSPFNTHPFMAGVLAGAVLRMEERGSSLQEINGFLRGAMGPLAAVGDPFFRGALPHAAAVLSTLVAIRAGALAGALTLLIAFNVFHLVVRARGVFIGYREGVQVLPKVARWMSPARTRGMQTLTALGAGTLIVMIAIEYGNQQPWWVIVAAVATTLTLALALVKWRTALPMAVPAVLIAALLFEVWI